MPDTKSPCLTVLGGPIAGTRFVLQDEGAERPGPRPDPPAPSTFPSRA